MFLPICQYVTAIAFIDMLINQNAIKQYYLKSFTLMLSTDRRLHDSTSCPPVPRDPQTTTFAAGLKACVMCSYFLQNLHSTEAAGPQPRRAQVKTAQWFLSVTRLLTHSVPCPPTGGRHCYNDMPRPPMGSCILDHNKLDKYYYKIVRLCVMIFFIIIDS